MWWNINAPLKHMDNANMYGKCYSNYFVYLYKLKNISIKYTKHIDISYLWIMVLWVIISHLYYLLYVQFSTSKYKEK